MTASSQAPSGEGLIALIARLEASSEGSRELDLAIEKAARRCPQDGWREANDEVHWHEVHPFGSTMAYEPLSQPLPVYTTSLDAALTLVPENFVVYQLTIWPGDGARVAVWGTHKEHSDPAHFYHSRKDDGAWEAQASTGPLALCIAALRARQASQGEKP